MGLGIRALIMVSMTIFALTSVANAAEGTATFYTPYVPSSCYGYQNNGVMVAAASDAIWENRTACGRSYRVRCTEATNQSVSHHCKGTSIVVKIVDYCPTGCQATIDLFQEAFSAIANPDAGKINIEYTLE
ncbi:EG45-like domain containing protein [Carya illinoinensis]|uniref:Expansin-like EG45 domain-containing protein n=1 Tax=Carya illinoinensis TaxID=32201 RepID=A0A8T1PMU1_CARIL|nr:EG45-like domain containing protein [Carya illinoinensis]KAG6644205.1 hypothetical protein CIPAW_08G040000 [Carya illinoinensis]KAG6698866.1 hypothetical protein I3842_08G040900 [Carya illinoinensis]